MTEIVVWEVTIIESERGYGQRVDSIEEFATYEAAKEYQVKFNKPNEEDKSGVVPDWYMVAREPCRVAKNR